MKFKSIIIAAIVLTGFAGNAWADTDKLTVADGWTKITSVPTSSDIANNYYVFVDATQDLMLGIGKGEQNTKAWYSLGLYYRTSVEPTSKDITPLVWTLESNDGGFSMRNLDQPVHVFQTEWNAAWYFDTNDVTSSNEWSKVNIALSDGKFTLENGKYIGNYIGPWSDNNFTNGAECAANKTTALRGYFYIYAISRTQFKQNLLDNASNSNPVDLTPWYITNATFDGNSDSGWTTSFSANSSGWWGSHAFSNLGAENYQQVAEVKQTLTLPNGKYKVSLQGATNKVSENEAYVFATHNGSTEKTYFTQSTVSTADGSKWNDMQYNLLLMMQDRSYRQVLTPEVTVTTSSLTIGYKNEGGWSWDVFDNFKLYCTGVDLSAYVLQLSDLVGECNDFIESDVVPTACETAISEAISTYDSSYETAKEYSTAIITLTTILDTYRNDTELQAAYAAYKSMRTNVQGLENTSTYHYTDPGSAKSTFDGAISSANTAVEAATTASAINTQTATIRAAALTFISSVTAEDGNPFNITFLASQTISDWKKKDGSAAGEVTWAVSNRGDLAFAESYEGTAATTGIVLYQTISNLPAGYYRVGMYAMAAYTPGRDIATEATEGDANRSFAFAGDLDDAGSIQRTGIAIPFKSSFDLSELTTLDVNVHLSSDGNLTYGVQKDANGSNWHFAQIMSVLYSNAPDLTALKATRDALVSEATGLKNGAEADYLTDTQKDALQDAIDAGNAADDFDEFNTVTMITLPNAINTAKQQIKTVKDNRVLMIAALERFENDYNLTDGTDYCRSTMSAKAWTDLLDAVNDVTTALDDVSQASSYGTLKDALVSQMDATDASLRLFKSYKAMVEGTTALSIVGDYDADSNMDTDATQVTAITALNSAFLTYVTEQSENFSTSAFLGENLDFSADAGSVIKGDNDNTIKAVAGWEVNYADADTWAVLQTDQSSNTNKLYMRKNWGSAATVLSVAKYKMLPVGKYTLSLSWNSNMANMTNLSHFKVGDETPVTIGENSDGKEPLTYDFTVTEGAQPFDLVIGFQKTGTDDTPAQIIVDDVTLTYSAYVTLNEDATEVPAASDYANVTLNRAFNAGWNAVCLPFDAAAFDGCEIAEFTGETADGNDITLNFNKVDAFVANTPYLVYFPNDVESGKTFYGVAFSPSEVKDEGTAFDFMGVYQKTDISAGDWVISGGQLKKASQTINLKGTRTYFTPKVATARIAGFTVDDGTTTDVLNLLPNINSTTYSTYDLKGQKMRGMPKKGVFILHSPNGSSRKVVK